MEILRTRSSKKYIIISPKGLYYATFLYEAALRVAPAVCPSVCPVPTVNLTISSAVAKRPRDASCLSVVSFVASIVQYLERSFFILSYFSFGFTSAYNSILFCCLRRNVKPSKICLFVLTQSTNVSDTHTQTDRQTPHDCIGRAYA